MANHEYCSNDEEKSLMENVKEYVKLQVNLLKINFIEKISHLLVLVVALLSAILLFLGALAYLSVAFIQWTATLWGTGMYGALIIGGIHIILALIFYFYKEKIFLNPLIRKISSIFFEQDQEGGVDE